VLTGRAGVAVTGLLLLALLVGLQYFLAIRFRRLLNPGLALATLAALVLLALSIATLTGQANDLRDAKENGFDSVLALSRARAISNNANADETRFLLDPGRADTYEQVFLSKSQSVLYVPAGNLATYSQSVQEQIDLSRRTGERRFLGLLGNETRRQVTGQSAAIERVLADYGTFQSDDREIRRLVASGQRDEAIRKRLSSTAASPFSRYDTSLNALVDLRRGTFTKAVRAADDGTSGWHVLLPAAGLVIVALVLVGVRPRLAEYR
jgi:hypothetical protein